MIKLLFILFIHFINSIHVYYFNFDIIKYLTKGNNNGHVGSHNKIN